MSIWQFEQFSKKYYNTSTQPIDDIKVGSDLAFAPGIQGNLAARKEWAMASGHTGHYQAQLTWSDDSYSDVMEPNKAIQDSYRKE